METTAIKILNEKFKEISNMGYVKTSRNGSTGIGKTFEDLIGKTEDRQDYPDFMGIEIKTKLYHTKSYITLFNATPLGESEYEIKRLQEVYGYPDRDLKYCKVLHSSAFANSVFHVGTRFLFKLFIDYDNEKIILKVLNRDLELIDDSVYWPFDFLKERLERKLNYLAFVKGFRSNRNGIEHYKYYDIKFYKLRSFESFLKAVENGFIKVTFHIGVIKEGERKGELHDRGTAFEIPENRLETVFEKIKV